MMKPQRKSPRLPGYDYSQEGTYFITICTHNRQALFGCIENDEMKLNHLGELASQHWHALPQHRSYVEVDEFVVMPNHVHALLVLHEQKATLGTIIGGYKAGVSRQARKQRLFDEIVWQERYHDYIVRNEAGYLMIKAYIQQNPQRWKEDKNYVE